MQFMFFLFCSKLQISYPFFFLCDTSYTLSIMRSREFDEEVKDDGSENEDMLQWT